MSVQALPIELKIKANEELNEVEDRIPEDIQCIREWLQKQQHLTYKDDDRWILSFLRGCKFSLEQTKSKLDYYYTSKSLLPEIFSNRNPFDEEIQQLLNAGISLPLPKTQSPTSPRIFLSRWSSIKNAVTAESYNKLLFMGCDVALNDDNQSVICGFDLVADLGNVPNNFLTQYTPLLLKKLLLCLQYAYPIRVKTVYCINAPPFQETLYNFCKPFLSGKIKNRVYIFSKNHMQNFYDIFPRELMPAEYGGNNGSLVELTVMYKAKLESYRDWFTENEKYCSNEQLRIGKPNTLEEEFGVNGSFRKLAVD